MSSFISRFLNLLPLKSESRQFVIDRLIPATFGQLGEDAVIDNHLGWLGLDNGRPGIYLDIGAHHPSSGSNTFRFYRRGSWGFAVDVGKRKEALWKQTRHRDQFIEAAVVPDNWPQDHVEFLATKGYGIATDHVRGFDVGSTRQTSNLVQVRALRAGNLAAQVLAEPAWLKAPWRLLNVDIEGLDHRVLMDLQLEKLRPDVVAVESFLPHDVSNWDKVRWHSVDSPLVRFLGRSGYSLQSVCGPTLVLLRTESMNRQGA
jgi:hypothetical protein